MQSVGTRVSVSYSTSVYTGHLFIRALIVTSCLCVVSVT